MAGGAAAGDGGAVRGTGVRETGAGGQEAAPGVGEVAVRAGNADGVSRRGAGEDRDAGRRAVRGAALPGR